MQLDLSTLTDIGRVRDENQDSVDACWVSDQHYAFLIVADGMGGYAGGARASQLAVGVIGDGLRQLPADPVFDTSVSDGDLCDALDRILQEANRRILAERASQPRLAQMGTTVVVAVIWGEIAVIGHVGDSRAYRWQRNRLEQLTSDHTLVQELVDHGALTPEQAAQHPRRNTLTRALGADARLEATYRSLLLQPGDSLLLCSDGLTTHLDSDALGVELARGLPAAESCRRLVAAANGAGGHDNTSVAIAVVHSLTAV